MGAMRRLTLLSLALGVLLLAAAAVMPGCNTVEGFGEDLEEAGQALQDAADR